MKITAILLGIMAVTLSAQSCPDTGAGADCGSCGSTDQPASSVRISRTGATTVVPEGTGIHFYSVTQDMEASRVSISFALQDTSPVNLALTDMDGNIVMDIAEGYYEPGNYLELFDTEGLSSGMYIVRLDALGGTGYTVIYLLD